MNKEIQSILLRRKSKLFFTSSNNTAPVGYVGAIIANVASFGYVLDDKLIAVLDRASASELDQFNKLVIEQIKNQLGAVKHKPMYPNFPDQVANASDEELYLNAIMHYFGAAIGMRIMPEYEEEIRFPFFELTKAKWIGLATPDDILDCFISLLEAKSSPSIQDREDIDTFFNFFKNEGMGLKNDKINFQNKETMAYVCGKHPEFISSLKTATDVLRVVVAWNNGDISLAKNTKFGKLSRPTRRLVLSTLERMNSKSVGEDMMRFRQVWIRLGEKLHAGEYSNQFPKTAENFKKIRNKGAETFNSELELYLRCEEWKLALELLTKRPGDFARRLNAILTKADNKMVVMSAFKQVANKVSTPVLWQLHGYFSGREAMTGFRNRLFLPKGQTSKAIVAPNNLEVIPQAYNIGMVQVIEEALNNVYSESAPIIDAGTKVWIDPICKNLLIPTGNRSASTALRQVGRGSRFKLGDNKSTVRLFVYLKDVKVDNGSGTRGYYGSRVDLDLSAIMFDKNWKSLGQCSWTNLRHGSGKNAQMVHSGDITSAPNGASEFLDINLDKLPDNVAYIAANVYCYTGQKMNQLQTGFMGWMEREYAGSGEIYEPKSVEGRCDLTADATSTTPLILDVKNREIVWADLAITLNGWRQSTETTMDGTIASADLITRMSATRANLDQLFNLRFKALGAEIVENREDATFVISEDGNLSPYDVAKIMADVI